MNQNSQSLTTPPKCDKITLEVETAFAKLYYRLRGIGKTSLVWIIVNSDGTPREIVGVLPMVTEKLGE